MDGSSEYAGPQRGYGIGVRTYSLIETIEAFSSEHTEPIDELIYEWPSSKFMRFYEAYVRRKVADELSDKRNQEMAALWANINLKDEDRQKVMTAIDNGYSTAIAKLYGELDDEIEEIDMDDPFYKAMERGIKKRQLQEE